MAPMNSPPRPQARRGSVLLVSRHDVGAAAASAAGLPDHRRGMMPGQVVDWSTIGKVILVALVASLAVSAGFAFSILGAVRSTEMRRDGRALQASAYRLLGFVGVRCAWPRSWGHRRADDEVAGLRQAARASRRSRSSSEDQAPTEARTSPLPGSWRTTTPPSAMAFTARVGVRIAPGDERGVAARCHLAGRARLSPSASVRASGSRASWTSAQPASASSSIDAERPGGGMSGRERPGRGAAHPRAAAGRAPARVLEALEPGHARRHVARGAPAHVEAAGAVGAAEPLLAGRRVEVAAELAHVDRHRAEPLGAVEQHAARRSPRSAADVARSARSIHDTCEQATRRVLSATGLGELGERHEARR